jgi:SAM-dependent methyltransferase
MDSEQNEVFGESILNELESATRFSEWMYETIAPYLGDRIFEIGSGIGNISRQLPVREGLTLSDYSSGYRARLGDSFRDVGGIDVVEADLTTDECFQALAGRYDCVVCLNVLEHIEDDIAALRRMGTLLESGGRLIILVPQYRFLMSDMDRSLGHYRRYSRGELKTKLEEAGLSVEVVKNFNVLGIPGWYINNTLLNRTSLGANKVRLFDLCVPVVRLIERAIPLPGLSVIGVGVKE